MGVFYVSRGNYAVTTANITDALAYTPVNKTGDTISGTFAGSPTFSGNPTFSGSPTFSGKINFTSSLDPGIPSINVANIFNSTGDLYFNIAANETFVFRVNGLIEASVDDDKLDIRDNWLEMEELATAPTGTSNEAKIFAQDNGSGKTKLMVIFGTGAAQQIAIQPP